MKKCISILLIAFLFLNSGGFIIIFYQAQHSVKTKILFDIRKGSIPADKLVKFIIVKNQLHKNVDGIIWKEENEFVHNGMLYDVVKKVENSGRITLFCINDLTEEKIINNFNDEISDLASGKLSHSKYRTSLLNIISQALFLNAFDLPLTTNKQVLNSGYVPEILLVPIEIPFPPPRFT